MTMPKFKYGTEVQVSNEYPFRSDLAGAVFQVNIFKYSNSVNPNDEEVLDKEILYRTPFKSSFGRDSVWIPEEYISEFNPDKGFSFDETKPAWSPNN